MGNRSNGPYRDARPQDPIPDATNALAHRLRIAAQTGWDGERCDAAASEFVGELTARGWSPPRPIPPPDAAPTWRGRRNPEAVARGVAAARAALAAARTEPVQP